MKSPQVSKDKNKGFTLIEIVMVMAIIVIFGGLGLFYGLDNLWGHSFRSDRDTLVSALEHARAEAIANICRGTDCFDGKPHGIFIDQINKRYVLFQGNDYDPDDNQNIYLEAKYDISYSGINEIVFEQLSGDANAEGLPPWNIILSDSVNGKTSVITINNEGQILWTN